MTYAPADVRECLRRHPHEIATCGSLNYMLTRTGLAYVHINGKNYQTLQDVVSATIAAADAISHGTLPEHGGTPRGRLIDEFYRICRTAVGADVTAADIEGCLCCMRHEWIRRIVDPYADDMIKTNGDLEGYVKRVA